MSRFGVAVVLAGHSMPEPCPLGPRGARPARADVVPGTRGRTTADTRLIDAVEAHARGAGWSSVTTSRIEGLQRRRTMAARARGHTRAVELARRQYMDEERLVRHTRFQEVRGWCRGLVAKLGELALR